MTEVLPGVARHRESTDILGSLEQKDSCWPPLFEGPGAGPSESFRLRTIPFNGGVACYFYEIQIYILSAKDNLSGSVGTTQLEGQHLLGL